jgi:glucokinase
MNLLVADIGGTNARFGFKKNMRSEIKFINHLKCIDYNNIDDALSFYINKNKLKIDNMVLSVAGPCASNTIKLTNNNWVFEKNQLSKKFSVKSFLAINDFILNFFWSHVLKMD